MLDDLLEYHHRPEDSAFVTEVMKGVKRQQRLRRSILTAAGVIGAAFGVTGAIMLSEPLAQAMAEARLLPVSVGLVGVVAFFAWVFHDEVTTGG